MPQRRARVGPPRDYVVGDWPEGPAVADAPAALEHARLISIRLRDALVDRTTAHVAEAAGLARSTIYDYLAGNTWPDLVSLGKLEEVLGVELLPPLPQRDRVL